MTGDWPEYVDEATGLRVPEFKVYRDDEFVGFTKNGVFTDYEPQNAKWYTYSMRMKDGHYPGNT